MKIKNNLMKKKLTFLLLFVFALSISTNAQTAWEWDTHGIGFETPDNFVVGVNNSEEFSSSNEYVYVSLIPWNDETVTEEDLEKTLVNIAVEMEYDEITEAEDLEIDDFTGVGLNGKKDGVNAVIALLLDSESGTNLIVVIAYENGYDTTASVILTSIYAYD